MLDASKNCDGLNPRKLLSKLIDHACPAKLCVGGICPTALRNSLLRGAKRKDVASKYTL